MPNFFFGKKLPGGKHSVVMSKVASSVAEAIKKEAQTNYATLKAGDLIVLDYRHESLGLIQTNPNADRSASEIKVDGATMWIMKVNPETPEDHSTAVFTSPVVLPPSPL